MRKTLKNINTLVHDILHELGFPVVRKQVESREVHVLSAKVTDRTFVGFNNTETVLEVRTTVANEDDREDKILPFVTIGFTVTTTRTGQFKHVTRGNYNWKQFVFTSEAKLRRDIQKFFDDYHLKSFLIGSKKLKENQGIKGGCLATIKRPKEPEQLDLFFASATENK